MTNEAQATSAPGAAGTAGIEPSYRWIAESIPQLVWSTGPDGSPDFFNRRWLEFTGVDPGEIAGWSGVFHPDDRDRTAAAWRRAVETGAPLEIEYRLRRASDGSWRWFLVRGLPMRDAGGRIVRWFGTCTDIEEQKRAEALVRFQAEAGRELASSLDYRTTLRNVARMVVPVLADWCAIDVLEPDGSLRRVEVVHSDPEKEALGHELHRRWPPDPRATQGVPQVIRSGEPEWFREIPDELLVASIPDPELLAIMRDLGLRSALTVPMVARDRTLGAITLVYAESERRYGEAEVESAMELARRAGLAVDNARLYTESVERERQLEATLRALGRSNRDLDQFAYVASHDLKAPLRGIANLSQWIEEDLGPAVTPTIRDHLQLLRGRVHRMESLIEGILSYSRAGKRRTEAEPVDTGDLVREVVELQGVPASVEVAVEPGMPTVATERTQLSQVFLNLLGNAVKHAHAERPRIAVAAREVGPWYEFSVADNGPGIDPAFHERIWGIFQTLEPRDKVEGAGIGLAVVKKIVEARGGRAWVESSEGSGATFRFLWPKVEPEEIA